MRHVGDEHVDADDIFQLGELSEALLQIAHQVLVYCNHVVGVNHRVRRFGSDTAHHELVQGFQRVAEFGCLLQQLLLSRFHLVNQI